MHRNYALLALTLSLTGCAGEVATPKPVAPPAVAQPSSLAAPLAPSTTSSPSPIAQVIDVTVARGAVTGVGARVQVPLNRDVVIRVTSDVAEEVHVHGYDLRADVPAGGTVEIPFTATIPGGFAVEVEKSGKLLFQLRVA